MQTLGLISLIAGVFLLCALFLGGAMDRQHPSCQEESPLDRDREFIDPLEDGVPCAIPPIEVWTVPARQGPPRGPFSTSTSDNFGNIEVICCRCLKKSNILLTLPGGETICSHCREKLILDAVFAPLE
jgi:hypothetical protein